LVCFFVCCLQMSPVLLLLVLTSQSNVLGRWNWTHPVQETFFGKDRSSMTSNRMKFKRVNATCDGVEHFSSKENSTQLMCANECIELQRCVTFGFNPLISDTNGRCWLYDFRLLANADNVTLGEEFTRFFEIEVTSPNFIFLLRNSANYMPVIK